MLTALGEHETFLVSEHRREDARRRVASVVFVALVYAVIVFALIFDRAPARPDATEIPVEIVLAPPEAKPEPPKPKEAQPAEPAKPRPKDDAPAYDAPKSGTAKNDDPDHNLDGKPPPAAAAPDKTAEQSSGAQGQDKAPDPQASAEPTPEATPAPLPPLKTAEDGELPESKPAAPSTAAPAPTRPKFAAGKGKLFASLPSVEFGGAPAKAPIAGGEGPNGYLNIVVGMVRAHFRKPHLTRPVEGTGYGVILFHLDGDGRVMDSWFVQHSGSPEFDRAELEAISAAAPYPKPPYPGRGIEFHFNVE